MAVTAEKVKEMVDQQKMKMADVAKQLNLTLGQVMDLYYGTCNYSKEMDVPSTPAAFKSAVEAIVLAILKQRKLIK